MGKPADKVRGGNTGLGHLLFFAPHTVLDIYNVECKKN